MTYLISAIQQKPSLWEQLTFVPLLIIGLMLWMALSRFLWSAKDCGKLDLSHDKVTFYLMAFLGILTLQQFSFYFVVKLSENSSMSSGHGIEIVKTILPLLFCFAGFYFLHKFKNKTPETKPHFFKMLSVALISFLLLMPLIDIAFSMNKEFLIYIDKEVIEHAVIDQLFETVREDKLTFFLVAFSTVIVVPIFEELVFRGLLQPALSNLMGLHQGIIIQSLFFTVIHPEHTYLPIFVFALTLSYTRQWSHSLIPCILMHMFLNGYNVLSILMSGSSS